MNVQVQRFFLLEILISFPLNIYRSDIAEFYGSSIFNFLRNLHSFPDWMYKFAFPPAVHQGSLCSTSSLTFVICDLFDNSHFNSCEVIPHCGFYLHFPDDENCWAPFLVLLVICMSYLEKCLFKASAHVWINFFFPQSYCMGSLYVLDMNSLSDI